MKELTELRVRLSKLVVEDWLGLPPAQEAGERLKEENNKKNDLNYNKCWNCGHHGLLRKHRSEEGFFRSRYVIYVCPQCKSSQGERWMGGYVYLNRLLSLYRITEDGDGRYRYKILKSLAAAAFQRLRK